MTSQRRASRAQARAADRPAPASPASLPSRAVLWVPFGLTLALLALTALPRIGDNPRLALAFWIAGGGLLVWQALLALGVGRAGVAGFVPVPPRPQHYIQMCCHLSVYAYWGYYWAPVYPYAPLLVGQVFFAYAFDMLLSWTRRQPYGLGFGPFPIVFSTNLFLWFKDDWFAFQFLLLAVGFLGKAFVRWERDGKLVHIFNPSAFTLALFSLILILTGTTETTWAQEINTTFSLGPRMYTVLFLIGLVVMYFFAITPVTAMAAATLFGLSALYMAVTGVPYFVDSEIPTAVFLGLHLLVTDPSTSPRTPLGRAIFGVLYGLGVFTLYALLTAVGAPTFYDKLLAVPILNLLVPAIDHLVARVGTPPLVRWVGLDPPIGHRNLAHMAVWIAFFALMTVTGRTDGMHPGDSLPFWQQACAEGRTHACDKLLRIESSYCSDNSGWACNELGRHYLGGTLVGADATRALGYFSRACEGRFQPGCLNLLDPSAPVTTDPRPLDLRLLLREGGLNLLDMPEPDLYARACRHGWSFACGKQVAAR
jgi:Na+-translocating ferredoxin:NAD+ oxidoreductase RnfD subunit